MFWCSACNSLLGTLCPGLPQVCICTPEEHGWGEKTVEVTGLNQAMALTTEERGCADQLARFFPNLPGVRIPVRVAPLRAGSSPARVQ